MVPCAPAPRFLAGVPDSRSEEAEPQLGHSHEFGNVQVCQGEREGESHCTASDVEALLQGYRHGAESGLSADPRAGLSQ